MRSLRVAIFPVVYAKGVSAAAALAVLALSCLTVSAQAATGLEPGVHVDPGSPAAKEYALPINQARQTGAAPGQASSGSAALFGAGIKPPGSGGSGQGGSRGGRPPSSARHDASGTASSSPGAPLPAIVRQASRAQNASSGSGSMLALLGGGAAILILGAFGGTIMRRNHRSSVSDVIGEPR
jgi:hypothetical protein